MPLVIPSAISPVEPPVDTSTAPPSVTAWRQLKKRWIGIIGLGVLAAFLVVGIYAPVLASSKPLVVRYDGTWYFPLFRYLFFNGFYTKNLDIFFNLAMFTFPLFVATWWWRRHRWMAWTCLGILQFALFGYLLLFPVRDPTADAALAEQRHRALEEARHGTLPPAGKPQPGQWAFDIEYMNAYARLNLVLRYRQQRTQDEHLQRYAADYGAAAWQRWLRDAVRQQRVELAQRGAAIPSPAELERRVADTVTPELKEQVTAMPTLWQITRNNDATVAARYREQMASATPGSAAYSKAAEALGWLDDRRHWLEVQNSHICCDLMPLLRPYHWQDDAGGEQSLNRYLSWLDLTRTNRKDLVAALLFGVRVSLVVGVIAVLLALVIGIPIGAFAGFYGGTSDIVVCRLLEIWEAMPAFFMLLMVVAIAQSKSIFLVITVIGIFGWTAFSRYIRGEFLKQRNLAYVEACRCLGFNNRRIIFSHILPNAIPPILTLLPFAVMGAISSEAGLSFLGLGEEGSCSWGVLMDEGRNAFPGESYLLWPPALLLTTLLIATALVGDALRDALDPKLHH